MSRLDEDKNWKSSTTYTIDDIHTSMAQNYEIKGSSEDDTLIIDSPEWSDPNYVWGYHNIDIKYDGNGGYDILDYDASDNDAKPVTVTAGSRESYDLKLSGGYDTDDSSDWNSLDVYIRDVEEVSLTDKSDTVDLSGVDEQLDIIIDGDAGDDEMEGSDFDDTFLGNEGDDYLFGAAGDDTLEGGDGDDTIDGGTGDDSLSGDDGDDVIDGGTGDDTIDGGSGDDTIDGGLGDDEISGGSGTDTVQFDSDFDEYSISYDSETDTFTITSSDEGTDTVSSDVEYFEFNGEIYSNDDLFFDTGEAPAVPYA